MTHSFRLPAFAAGILMLAVACERIPVTQERTVRFEAETPDTRTAFTQPEGDLYPVVWTAKDRNIRISLNGATPVEAAVEPAANGRTARFQATFTEPAEGSATFYALSPSGAYRSLEGGEWTYTVPTCQTPGSDSVDPEAMVLAATSSTTEGLPEEVSLQFRHLTAYGRLSLVNLNTDIRAVTLDLGGDDTLRISTTCPEAIWFGTMPKDVSGKEMQIRVKTGSGSYAKTVTFPEGRVFEAGKIARFTVDMASATFVPDNTSISILAIGNSFSVDAMEYLYGYLRQAGYTDIFLGNLYIGGCTLQTHAGNITNGSAAYRYYTNSTGSWSYIEGKDAVSAMQSRKWDYVSMQQASGWSGMPDSYEPYLSTVVNAVKTYCPDAKRIWHMTWAYQKDSSHSDFTKYGNNQLQMYEAILATVQSKVLAREDFDFVIPCGTAIQNLRTSFMRDHMTRDGYHMSYQVGRVTTALMCLKQISGAPLSGISIRPSGQTLSETQVAAIKDAVEQAYTQPFAVTQSAFPIGNAQPDEAIRAQFSQAGYDPSHYKALPLDLVSYAYYNSTSSSTLISRMAGSTASNLNQFCTTTGVFSREDIPVGSVIVLKPGYQYRPEGWTSLSTKNASSARPGNVQTQIVTVTDAWWGNWKYRAFNLAEAGNPPLTEEKMNALQSCFAIFVPIE